MGGAAVLKLTGPSATLAFAESHKGANVSGSGFFRQSVDEARSGFGIAVEMDGACLDEAYIVFDSLAKAAKDPGDAEKLCNPGLNLATRTPAGDELAVDVRPYVEGEYISLGFRGASLGAYGLKLKNIALTDGKRVYLIDEYTGSRFDLSGGGSYCFNVAADTLSRKAGRFRLQMGRGAVPADNEELVLSPNPARDRITISVANHAAGKARIRILSPEGEMFRAQLPEGISWQVPVSGLPRGFYLAELTIGTDTYSQKFVKEN